ncbi:outer dense fiber protein 3-like protein 2 [Heterocephalus glaber]|uniref:Outer dense fiber protein 3-like protein 2 n=1 Tax=Heterocephalus glaber TaxID=10181 RepID=A0AAX6RV23_HETGA|nr:outer dense fiber protein 3-like protein 2 [Heterocephalus glaber]
MVSLEHRMRPVWWGKRREDTGSVLCRSCAGEASLWPDPVVACSGGRNTVLCGTSVHPRRFPGGSSQSWPTEGRCSTPAPVTPTELASHCIPCSCPLCSPRHQSWSVGSCLVPTTPHRAQSGSGPGLYILPTTVGFVHHDCTRVTGPAYSLARKPSEAPPQDTSPGPIYFLDPKVTRFGRSCTPAYSMQGRGKSRGMEVTPGPGAYSPEKVPPVRQRNPPAFTLGLRLYPKPPDSSAPAPNAYTMPPLWGSQILVKPRSPSYTVVGRTPPARLPQDPAKFPGPGQYDSPDPNAYRQRRPAFTMLGRPRAPQPLEETPGPGSHSPEQVTVNRARAPAYSMGIRHSKRAARLALDTAP